MDTPVKGSISESKRSKRTNKISDTKFSLTKFLRFYSLILLGSLILASGLFNIHQRTMITEGGVLGLVLLFKHWFNISPSISSPVLDIICYALGYKFLGKRFIKSSIVATGGFAIFYFLLEKLNFYILPDLSDLPLVAAILGGLFVGVGVGLVVKRGGASGGDDALALVLNHVLKINISFCYLFTDITVLALSLSYIPLVNILYSVVTVTTSSFTIGFIQKLCKKTASETKAEAN